MSTLPACFRDRMIDAVREITGTRAEVVGTGGGCEALIVEPLEGGRSLFITDADAGVPDTDLRLSGTCPSCVAYWTSADEYVDSACDCAWSDSAWMVSVSPHLWGDECPDCGDCLSDAPFTTSPKGDLTIDALRTAVIRALSGEDEHEPIVTRVDA